MAIEGGHKDTVKYLVDNGAVINLKDCGWVSTQDHAYEGRTY